MRARIIRVASAARRSRRAAAAAVAGCVLPAAIAAAAGAAVEGAHGNAEGCAYLLSGQLSSDALLYLTPKEVGSYGTTCEFQRTLETTADSLVVDGLCHFEGEETTARMRLTLTRAADGSYTIGFDDGNTWGPLPRCP